MAGVSPYRVRSATDVSLLVCAGAFAEYVACLGGAGPLLTIVPAYTGLKYSVGSCLARPMRESARLRTIRTARITSNKAPAPALAAATTAVCPTDESLEGDAPAAASVVVAAAVVAAAVIAEGTVVLTMATVVVVGIVVVVVVVVVVVASQRQPSSPVQATAE